MASHDDIDVIDPELFTDGPPHELFERMRAEAPVRWNEHGDSGFWSITRHADIKQVSRDSESFSSYVDGIFPNRDQVVPLDLTRNLLLYKDPPEHTKYRKIMQTAFVPNTVNKLEPEVRVIVTEAIDDVIEAGECDFVRDIAVPVPLRVLAHLMGVPRDDVPQFYEWTEKIEEAQRAAEGSTALPTFMEMAGYLNERIAEVEGDDGSLVARLRDAEVDGEKLTDDEILVFFGLLVFAGNDTTRNTMSSGTLALLEDRDQWERLRAQPDLIPQAVEEILRYTSVVNYFCRTAIRDTEVGGQPIAAGEKVMIWYTSGSRDGDVCPDAQDFDTSRAEQDHMAFGGGGRHFCLGAGLARLELRVLFEEITRRLGDLELTGEPERILSPWANSLTSLPVRFTPGEREG